MKTLLPLGLITVLSTLLMFCYKPIISHKWISIGSGFSQKQRQIIQKAMSDWDARYHCERQIAVDVLAEKTKILPNGVQETTLESAWPGKISLISSQNDLDLRNSVLHAMTHACQPDSPTTIAQNYLIEPGVEAYGYHGASILVTLKNGEKTAFRKIEEGICERNASYFEGYNILDSRYFAVGKLARQHFTNDLVVGWVKRNDIPALVASLIGKQPNNVTQDDIRHVMTMYMKTWNKAE